MTHPDLFRKKRQWRNPFLFLFLPKIRRLKKTLTHILLLFLGLITLPASAQSWNETYSFHLTYSNVLKTNPPFAAAFNQLAYNNDVSVLGLSLDLNYRARFSLSRSPSGIPVLRYQVSLNSISGSTRFRDFGVDTLLIPQKVEAVLRVYQNQQLVDVLHQEIFIGREQVLLPVSDKIPLSSLYITFQILQPVFTKDNYTRFIRTAGLINHYYGYEEIIRELPRLVPKVPDIHPAPSAVFLNYIALTRLAAYINSRHFAQKLHLNKKDPLHFRRHYAAVLRKLTRMQTLSEEFFKQKQRNTGKDKTLFARGYAGLSMTAVAQAKQHQPFVAASFTEFSRIYPDPTEQQRLKRISRYYDAHNLPGQPTVSQEIYKAFLGAASFYIRGKAFVRALDMLSNAGYFQKHFADVSPVPAYDTLLLHARDGLAFSYVHVAGIALQHKNESLAAGYLMRAMKSLHEPKSTGRPEKPLCYSQTARAFDSLAALARTQQQPENALELLGYADSACRGLPQTRELTTGVCRLWLQIKLEKIGGMVQNGQTEKAVDLLLSTPGNLPPLCRKTPDTIRNDLLREKAAQVSNRLLFNTEHALQQKDIQRAMTLMRNVSRIQAKFGLSPTPLYDSIVRKAALPYILSLVEQTRLEIWRKNFQRADSLIRSIRTISRQYGIEQNPQITASLRQLSEKIATSYCQWKQQQIQYLLQQTGRAIKENNLFLAESNYLKAQKINKSLSGCSPPPDTLRILLTEYTRLFRFAHDARMLTQQLFQKGFTAVIPEYAMLDLRFRKGHFERLGFPFTPLFTFVQQQHADPMTMEVIRFYLRIRRFQEGFRYLQLLSDPSLAKTEQKQLGRAFVHYHIVPQPSALSSADYTYFASAYKKALASGKK